MTRASIIPIIPAAGAGLPVEGDARIDVAIISTPGRARHALGIGLIRAVAGGPEIPALHAPGIIVGGGGTGARQGGAARRQYGQHGHCRIAHDRSSPHKTVASPRLKNEAAIGRFRRPPHSTCAPANLTTFSHFSVSAAIIAPKASGVEISGSPPSSVRRFFISGSASTALTSLLSFSMISGGVFFGAPMPNSALAS